MHASITIGGIYAGRPARIFGCIRAFPLCGPGSVLVPLVSSVCRYDRLCPGFGGLVSQQIEIASIAGRQTCVARLAQLFPSASCVRLPVRVTKVGRGKKRVEEQTVIEFGTSHEVLFASGLPLEFEDRVRVASDDGSFDARATVVAVRYHDGRKAVAVRFIGQVANWIIKP